MSPQEDLKETALDCDTTESMWKKKKKEITYTPNIYLFIIGFSFLRILFSIDKRLLHHAAYQQ